MAIDLPEHLAERCRPVGEKSSAVTGLEGELVVYWMRTALRGHENPALDTAVVLAERLGRPLLVYHALSQRYPFASDRHHVFILEGAREVAAELAELGIPYAFHLERPGHDGPVLAELAVRAAVVVTEDMPVAPLDGWTERLAGSIAAPVLAVDTACVVPMRFTERPYERAFAFRRATAKAREERVERSWPEMEASFPVVEASELDLPFEPLDPRTLDIAEAVAGCEIDHSVWPVPASPGGSEAGYGRWSDFRDGEGLEHYSRRRNDPLRDGTSRLSPYLHYGMVSPFRIAREAAEIGGKGAEKFLDELLVWRELAYHFCFHRDDHMTVGALPEWAREGLAKHEDDPRPAVPSWETLARGRTGDALWDAAQTSLLRHGELHNNLRMTWGKALVPWTPNAARALELLEDLNHRYALDGRDPASYGGILWCLGQFDRPFQPEKPTLGPLRPRSTESHARRLDVESYRARSHAPVVGDPPRVLVIGAGVAGLVCARTLADAGLEVEVVDKGRRPAGRISTRRLDAGDARPATFDHGAQYFTVRDRRFRPWLESWLVDQIVARWDGRIGTLERGTVGPARGETERFVGVPGMSALARHLATGLEVTNGCRVVALRRASKSGGWIAVDDGGLERRADQVILALPAPQVVDLLAEDDPFSEKLARVRMAPCLAVMAAFAERLPLELDGAFVSDSPLSWMARDSSKPGRPPGERWVFHAGPEFSRAHLGREPDELVGRFVEAVAAAMGRALPEPTETSAHRWRYALAEEGLGDDCLYDDERGLGVCGDWCPGARVEGALTSGVALAGDILRSLVISSDATESVHESAGDRPSGRAGQLRLDLD